VEKAAKDRTGIANIDKNKYLVPQDLTIGQFVFVVRKRVALQPAQALFLFVDGKIPASTATIASVYRDSKSDDGFLYVNYAGEDTFG